MDTNVVLSICIPTFNRSGSVYESVTKILDNYDCNDIEVIVSDNCSEDGTEEKLSTIHDKRFKYYKNDANIKWINLLKVMSYSTGQFSMLMSDEDDVKIEVLPELVKFLAGKPRLALVKSDVFNSITGGGRMRYKCNVESYYNKIEAINTWAYMSGIIYNNRFIAPILNKMDFTDYKRYQKIIGEYPHIWLACAICHRGGGVKFYPKVVIVHMRECKRDLVLDESKINEFVWGIERRFRQSIAICKSFKHLRLSELNSEEKVRLYCGRVRWIMNHSGLGYYRRLYGKDMEMSLKKYHPGDIQSLQYWRDQAYNIEKNIYLSYKITNLILVNGLWQNRKAFKRDCAKNWLIIAELYYDTVRMYYETRKYCGSVNADIKKH